MSYIGTKPTSSFGSATSQTFTGNNSLTEFTLNRRVSAPEDLEVFVSNVQQQPTESYTIGSNGLTLTFSEAPPSGQFYVVYRTEVTQSALTPNTAKTDKANTFTENQTIDANLIVTSDATSGFHPILKIQRDQSDTPQNNDPLGQLDFAGKNDAGQEVNYFRMRGKIKDASDGTEDGQLVMKVMTNGANADRITIEGGQPIQLDGGVDINGGELILDADADTSITADTDDQVDIKVGGTDTVVITPDAIELKGPHPSFSLTDTDDNNYGGVFYNNGAITLAADHGATGATGSINFQIDGGTKVSIDANGRVAIIDNSNTSIVQNDASNLTVNCDNSGGLLINNIGQTNGEFSKLLFAAHATNTAYPKQGIGVKRTGDFGVGDMVFAVDTNADANDVDFTADAKMTITQAGNIGVGVSPESTVKLEVNAGSDGAVGISARSDGGNGNNRRFNLIPFSSGGTYGGGLKIQTRNTSNVFNNSLTFLHNGYLRVGSDNNPRISLGNRTNTGNAYIGKLNDEATITGNTCAINFGSTTGEDFLDFHTHHSGLVGGKMITLHGDSTWVHSYFQNTTKGGTNAYSMYPAGSGNAPLSVYNKTLTSSSLSHSFQVNGSGVGSITYGSTFTSFNDLSDYRTKENVSYDWDATSRLKQLKPARFNFKVDKDTTVDGFLAHEVSDIVPNAITGTKDEVYTEDIENQNIKKGDPKYQSIDQSKLIPLLVKTIQELEARVTKLESK